MFQLGQKSTHKVTQCSVDEKESCAPLKEAPMRLYVSALLLSLVAALHTLVPTQAEAASALFSVVRINYNDGVGVGDQTISIEFDTASGYVGTGTVPKFTVPQSVIKSTSRYAYCTSGTCRSGYPYSTVWYSYWNLRGSFRPNNPYGATTATTVRFPTTMGSTGPPYGTGDPVTPTTTFSGNYDFSRAGSIMITPGANRFGGTMQIFYGPNMFYYQLITTTSSYSKEAYGYGQYPIPSTHESQVGEIVIGRTMYRFWTTSSSGSSSSSSSGTTYTSTVHYISTIAPFTTGRITVYQPDGETVTIYTLTGYDNRTTTMGGLSGVVSLVRPRLVHTYVADPFGSIWKARSKLSTWRIDFHFVPEPGGTTMIAAGVVVLAGLYRCRRRSVER
jgi:hypothetical protein